MMNTTR